MEVTGSHAVFLVGAAPQYLLVPAQQDQACHQVRRHVLSVGEQRVESQSHLLHRRCSGSVSSAVLAAKQTAYLPENPVVSVVGTMQVTQSAVLQVVLNTICTLHRFRLRFFLGIFVQLFVVAPHARRAKEPARVEVDEETSTVHYDSEYHAYYHSFRKDERAVVILRALQSPRSERGWAKQSHQTHQQNNKFHDGGEDPQEEPVVKALASLLPVEDAASEAD